MVRNAAPARPGRFEGYKTHLYEGGIRSSLIVWGPGLVQKQNYVDQDSVFSAIDLVPTLLAITNTPSPRGTVYDGEALPATLLGRATGSRVAPIFFRRPPDRDSFYGETDLPDLAVRSGKWKLLCEYDGSDAELYDLVVDRGETNNIADQHPHVVADLSDQLTQWHTSMPPDNGATYVERRRRK